MWKNSLIIIACHTKLTIKSCDLSAGFIGLMLQAKTKIMKNQLIQFTKSFALNQVFLDLNDHIVSVYQVVEGIKPTLLELQKFETSPEDVELEGNGSSF